MISAAEWMNRLLKSPYHIPARLILIEQIREIQADALRAAAEHMEHYSDDQGCDHCEVLVMADNLCPKPKV